MIKKTTQTRCGNNNRGTALIMAIMMLGVMTMLGTYYYGNMALELDQSNLTLDTTRTRLLADGAVRLAMDELQQAINQNRVPELLAAEKTYSFNTYQGVRDGFEMNPQLEENHLAEATVAFSSELPPAARLKNPGIDGGTLGQAFRITCNVRYARRKSEHTPRITEYVEAVAQFDEQGQYEIVYWSTYKPEEAV